MATRVTTAGTGAFKFAGKTYKIKSSTEAVTFILDDEENVTEIENLEGTVVTDLTEEITVNGDAVQVTGDKDNKVTIAASTGGVTEMSGINGENITIESFGKATKITTSSSGKIKIKEKEYEVKGDKNGVTINLDASGNVTGVTELDGTIRADFASGLSVNENEVKVSGESASVAASTKGISAISVSNNSEVTVASTGGATKITTDVDGKITIGKKSFELKESSGGDFVIGESGTVTGISNLKGSLTFTAAGTEFTVNKTAVTIGADDKVTITTNAKGTISGVFGLDTYIEGLPGNTTIAVTDQNVTVNGTGLKIDEGQSTEYILTLDKNGTPTQAEELSSGVIVYQAPNMELVTKGNGTFRIGDRFYTISGADSGATFLTDENSNATGIEELGGAISFKGDATLKVNGREVKIDKHNSEGEIISLFGTAGELVNVYGLESGDSIEGDLTGTAISMPGGDKVTLKVNETEYKLYGDSDGIMIIPAKNATAVKYLSANASLKVSEKGKYIVTNEEEEKFTITASAGDTITVDPDGIAGIYNDSDFSLNKNSSIEKIINTISKEPKNYVNLDSPITVYDEDINYNVNVVFDLSNTKENAANYNFSSNTTRKRISLGSGNQNLTLSGAGDNIVAVKNAAGNKNIVLGKGGDNAVVEETAALVTIYAGAGNDNIVSKSDITVYTNDTGSAKITPLNNATVTLKSYGDEEYKNATGVQTTLGQIAKAVKNNSIHFENGKAEIREHGTVIFNPAATNEGYTAANFYDKGGDLSKVVFLHTKGGTADFSKNTEDIIIAGNYQALGTREEVLGYSASITGGKANETIYAGAGDTINAGAGNNLIELSPNQREAAVIFITSKSANDSIKNFSSEDVIRTEKFALKNVSIENDTDVVVSLSNSGKFTLLDAVGKTTLIENYYAEGKTKFQFGLDRLIVNDTANYYLAGGENATVEIGKFSADSINLDMNYKEFDDNVNLRLNGKIEALDASNFSGKANLTGNDSENILIASNGNSTLTGGKGNDTLTGGYGADLFLFSANHGNDLIKNFNFGTDSLSDKISIGALTLSNVKADENNAFLNLSGGNLTIEGAVSEIVQFDNETFQFGYNSLNLSKVANYYWAGGENATLEIGEYNADSLDINLKNPDKIYGDIQAVNALNFEGALNLSLNKKDNLVTLSSGAAFVNYAGGNDTIFGWKDIDTLKIDTAPFSTIQSEENILVCVGKNSITLIDAAKIPLTIEGIIEGTDAAKTIVGSARADTITNTVTGAIITALAANDSIFNKGAKVSIDAGLGKDTITNSGANSKIDAGAGEDYIENDAASVTIYGGSGYDTIFSSGKNSSIHGGDGNDKISSTGANVKIYGGKGADFISNSGEKVLIEGADGADTIFSSGNNVTIEGGDGSDFVSISAASKNFLYQYRVGSDNDTIVGIKSGDTIKISGAKFSTVKSGKNLKINVEDNHILILNGMQNNFAIAGISTEEDSFILKGTTAADSLSNKKDLYQILALAGKDTITNSGSNVTINAGTGNDVIKNTGNGNIYLYQSGDGKDSIFGFTEDDTLKIVKGNINSSLVSGSDFTLHIGAGSVTFFEVSKINISDENGSLHVVQPGKLIQGTSAADKLSNDKDAFKIESFAANDTITNSGNNVTIEGGTGHDFISNSGKNVTYLYQAGDGKDTIFGFNSNDSLKISKGKISSSITAGNDLTLNIGTGSVLFKNIGADSNIFIQNADGSNSVLTVPRLIQGTNKADSLSNDKDSFLISALAGNDSIYSTGKLVTICAGAGNDAINISNRQKSKSNNGNLILYEGGKDSIYGFSTTDTLQISKGNIKSSLVSGSDFLINIGSGSVAFKDFTGGNIINLIDAKGISSTLTIPKILQGTAKADSLTNSLKDYQIEGRAGDDSITNTAAGVTIIGGKGNDSISNSVTSSKKAKTASSKTLYQYAAGDGNDVIYGFSENDTLQITKGTIKSTVISGEDFIVNVTSGSITIKDSINKQVNLLDAKGNLSTFTVPLMHVLTAKADYFINEDAKYFIDALAGSDSIENFAKNVTIDASEGKDYIYNVGTATSIFGGAGNDSVDNFADSVTICGGKGNDTVVNSGSKNIYQYEGGKDIIYGFSTTDTLQISKGTVKSINVNGMDVVVNVGSGSVTLTDAAGKNVNLLNAAGTLTNTIYSGVWEGTAQADYLENSTPYLNLKALGGNDTIKNYAANVSVNAGAGHDSITLDKSKNVTVTGGAGNDTITGSGSSSAVLYQYSSGDGKDFIVGFSKKDTIQVTSGAVKSVKTSGGNTVIELGSGSITLQKYTSGVNLVDKNFSAISANTWFAEDNNFIKDEISIDTIMEDKFDVTNLETENYSVFAQDETALSFSKEK